MVSCANNVSTTVGPARLERAFRTRVGGLGHRCPDPLDDEPWRRAWESNPATAGLQPASRTSEMRAIASPIRFERMTCSFGRSRAVQLRHGDVSGQGENRTPNVHGRVLYRHRGTPPARPALGVTARLSLRSHQVHGLTCQPLHHSHRAQRRARTSSLLDVDQALCP
jgi:hypothetical protein